MKRGTPRHPKMYDLAARLDISLPHAVGIMEMLWQHAAQHTPRGDIGSLPNTAIAEACCFRKADLLIGALILSKWLDKDDIHRLIIHDWPQHCEASVRKWLDRNSKEMLPVYGKCLDIDQTKGGQCLPSRGAMAEAKAVVDVYKKKSRTSLLSETQAGWFEQFWQKYWRRIAKGDAEKAFADAITTEDHFRKVMQSLELQAPWMLQRDSDKRPYPATWLNQKRWEDDPDVQQTLDTRTRDELSRHNVLVAALDRRGF